MAIPKTLKEIDEVKARKIIESHPEGYWEGMYMDSDFIYAGRKMRDGLHRPEMIRATRIWDGVVFEHGIVSL